MDQPSLLFHSSIVSALLEGMYEGSFPIKALKRHGDFGLGAFNHIDGEMVVLEGKVYHIRSDARAYLAADTMQTPFAFVNFFKENERFSLWGEYDKMALEQRINEAIGSENRICAIRIEGKFKQVKVRVNPPYYQKPYPPLASIIQQNQLIYDFSPTTGIFVGYRLPTFMEGVNVAGYHFHYLTHDREHGGHVLDYCLQKAEISLSFLDGYTVMLPKDKEFYEKNYSKEVGEALKKVE